MSASTKVHFWLDQPEDWSGKFRRLRLTGWCLEGNGEPLLGIRARLGKKTFPGVFDQDRPDVLEHLQLANAPVRCGFTLDLLVPYGKHRLELRVGRADGKWQKVLARDVTGAFRASPAERALWRSRDETHRGKQEFERQKSAPFSFWLDHPKDWNSRVRHLRVSGWCIANSGPQPTEIRARLRGKVFPGTYGILRPDVAVTIENEAALRSGFFVDLVVPGGWGKLRLEARRGRDDWQPFLTRYVRGPLLWARGSRVEDVGNYADWLYLHQRLTRRDKTQIRRQIRSWPRRPRFSILLPVYESEANWLRRAIDSVRRQLYPDWELCIVDDASQAPHVWPSLQRAARRDQRIRILRRASNGHICAASNDALEMATGDYVALLDHDDELAPAALYYAALELNRRPDLQFLYTDEDKIDRDGRRCDPYFKPDWDPDLLTSQNYISHLSIYATELVRKVGGFRAGFEGSQDYDLTLRCAEQIRPAQIHHIPQVLYHWRVTAKSTALDTVAKPYAQTAATRAVQEHLDRGPNAGRVTAGYAHYLRVVYDSPPHDALVSIVIPTRDRGALLRQGVESIRAQTDGVNFELIVLDNESREPETLEYLAALVQLPQVEVLRVPGAFNFSQLNNLGVERARGSFIALLNNDLEVISRDWLREMVSHAARPGVGAVGARLWYPDGRLQHGGVLLGVGGVATHAHRLLRQQHGYFARARLTQNFSAVTGACLVMRKAVFQEIGGFDETNLPVAFNDVDLCLRLRERDLLVVWTPYAELLHHESASRGFEDTGAKQQRFVREVGYMQERWGHLIEADPYYNPNLSIAIDHQFKLAFPPRTEKPWKNA
ncbi:MAG: glycosyltransferase family 2 protein [Chthoniobacterales bacterium]